MNTLADFKRRLAERPTVTLINCNQQHKALNVPRKVAKMQTNAVMFEGGSWLYFDKASNWSFADGLATYTDAYIELTYKLS
jgi:hypothetical protein